MKCITIEKFLKSDEQRNHLLNQGGVKIMCKYINLIVKLYC